MKRKQFLILSFIFCNANFLCAETVKNNARNGKSCNGSDCICLDVSNENIRMQLKDNNAQAACKLYSDAIYCEMQKIASEFSKIEKNITKNIDSNDAYKKKIEDQLKIIDQIVVRCFHQHTIGECEQDFQWYKYCRAHFEELHKRVTKLTSKIKDYSSVKTVNAEINQKYSNIIDRLLKISDYLSTIRSVYNEEEHEYRNNIMHEVKM